MIRPFLLQDAPLISQLHASGSHLDLRVALLWEHNSLAAAMTAYVPFSRRVRTLVLSEQRNGTRAMGYVQYRERRSFPEADILYGAPALDKSADGLVRTTWHQLISQLINRAGERGVQRVYARVLDGARELDLFWQLGFSAYARERTYRRNEIPTFSQPLPHEYWQPQHSRDVWNVGQLYAHITPKLVQQAENLPQTNT
ncbi:MAG: hypothetical protein LC737_00810, partial [Chloroflexi bacterium]|nr:hypothetical protein [Chloroflexota bacterium]